MQILFIRQNLVCHMYGMVATVLYLQYSTTVYKWNIIILVSGVSTPLLKTVLNLYKYCIGIFFFFFFFHRICLLWILKFRNMPVWSQRRLPKPTENIGRETVKNPVTWVLFKVYKLCCALALSLFSCDDSPFKLISVTY